MYYLKKIFYAALVTALYFGVEKLIKTPASLLLELALYVVMGLLIGMFIVPDISPKVKSKSQSIFIYIFLLILSCFNVFPAEWITFIPKIISSALSDASVLFQLALGIVIAFDVSRWYKARMKKRYE